MKNCKGKLSESLSDSSKDPTLGYMEEEELGGAGDFHHIVGIHVGSSAPDDDFLSKLSLYNPTFFNSLNFTEREYLRNAPFFSGIPLDSFSNFNNLTETVSRVSKKPMEDMASILLEDDFGHEIPISEGGGG